MITAPSQAATPAQVRCGAGGGSGCWRHPWSPRAAVAGEGLDWIRLELH